MMVGKDYLREVQKFTTSQYWSTGMRITAGVMVPALIMANFGWLTGGMPFLWGALFVSITDMPGPIHHRRNGMLAAIALNTFIVLVTLLIRDNTLLLLSGVIILGFWLSLLGVYGTRAGAVGTLALVIMFLHFVSRQAHQHILLDVLLVAAGGLWYTGLSLVLYRLRPYRLAEQAIGETLITIATYVKSRSSLYKEGADLPDCFKQIMQAQVEVRKTDEQTRELLFKTRQFVVDASPKSRSMMMLYLDAMDLFENSLQSHHSYESLHLRFDGTGVLPKFHGVILQLAAEIEHAGFRIQSGESIKKNIDLSSAFAALDSSIEILAQDQSYIGEDLQAIKGILANMRSMCQSLQRIVLYSRNEIEVNAVHAQASIEEVVKQASGHPLNWSTLRGNLNLESNQFRYSLRLTLALTFGFLLSLVLSLSHTYWVLLTIITILRPVYTQTRKRNGERLIGTFVGAFLALAVLTVIKSSGVLLAAMIICMLLAYSFLRVNYFLFVFFLTLFIVMTFHFLNPGELGELVKERVVDTLIGSVIAALASRFILPRWEHELIEESIAECIARNREYFETVWQQIVSPQQAEAVTLRTYRSKAIVALTNLSDKFQMMLAEPAHGRQSVAIHQMVIASHMLTGQIAALQDRLRKMTEVDKETQVLARAVEQELLHAENQVLHRSTKTDHYPIKPSVKVLQSLHPLAMLYALAHDMRKISQKMQTW